MDGLKYFHLIFHTTISNRQSTLARLNNSGEIEQTRIVCPLSDVGHRERKKNQIDRREKGAKMRIVQQRTKSLERVLCVCVWDTQTNLRVAVLAHL